MCARIFAAFLPIIGIDCEHRNIGRLGWDRVRRVDPDPDATSPIVIEETDSSLFKCRLDAHQESKRSAQQATRVIIWAALAADDCAVAPAPPPFSSMNSTAVTSD